MAVCSFIGHMDVYDADIEYRLYRLIVFLPLPVYNIPCDIERFQPFNILLFQSIVFIIAARSIKPSSHLQSFRRYIQGGNIQIAMFQIVLPGRPVLPFPSNLLDVPDHTDGFKALDTLLVQTA